MQTSERAQLSVSGLLFYVAVKERDVSRCKSLTGRLMVANSNAFADRLLFGQPLFCAVAVCAYLHLLQAGMLLLPVTAATLNSAMQCLQINLLLLYMLR